MVPDNVPRPVTTVRLIRLIASDEIAFLVSLSSFTVTGCSGVNFPGKFLDQEMITQNQLHFKSLWPILYSSSFQWNLHSVETHMHHKAS